MGGFPGNVDVERRMVVSTGRPSGLVMHRSKLPLGMTLAAIPNLIAEVRGVVQPDYLIWASDKTANKTISSQKLQA